LSDLPKSSFGEHKVHEKAMKRTIMVNWMHENSQIIALLLSIVLIYVFDTNFDRGLKVRLFVRHNDRQTGFSATSPEIGFIIVEHYFLAIL
jgi:hypothetical protein